MAEKLDFIPVTYTLPADYSLFVEVYNATFDEERMIIIINLRVGISTKSECDVDHETMLEGPGKGHLPHQQIVTDKKMGQHKDRGGLRCIAVH